MEEKVLVPSAAVPGVRKDERTIGPDLPKVKLTALLGRARK